MLTANLKCDIFDDDKIDWNDDEIKFVTDALHRKLHGLDLRNLYTLLRNYDELCEDYNKCTNNYTRQILIDRMQTLKMEIEQYCVVKYRG